MKKRLSIILLVLPFLVSCSELPHDKVVDNMQRVMQHDAITTSDEYDSYISDLDRWATNEAYDSLVEIPDSLRTISDEEPEKIETSICIDTLNVYAAFKNVDLDKFSDFYLFESEEYLVNTEGGDDDVPSTAWNDKLIEWFNPKKEHDVTKAECFIGYGYYTLTYDGIEYRYYVAIKCNKEGKVEKFINNYLGTN